MKLFLITPDFLPIDNKMTNYMSNLCFHFKWKSEIDPYIITSVVQNVSMTQVTDDGVYIFRIIENWGLTEMFKILKLIKKENPHIVHINYYKDSFPKNWIMNLLPFLIKKYNKEIKIITYINDFVYDLDIDFINIQKLIMNSDVIIVNSDYDANFLLSKIPDYNKKIRKIYSRTNIAYNSNIGVNRLEIRKRLKVADDGLLLIYFGLVNQDQGLECLFRASQQVLEHGKKIKLLIIKENYGIESSISNNYYEDLKKLACALGIDKEMFWVDQCSNEDTSMSLLSSDLAVLPFKNGVSGKFNNFWGILEHGIPTITTHTLQNKLPDGLQNGENIIAIAPENIDELTETIIKCFEEPDKYKQIGEKGQKLVKERYSWENMVNELADIYKNS